MGKNHWRDWERARFSKVNNGGQNRAQELGNFGEEAHFFRSKGNLPVMQFFLLSGIDPEWSGIFWMKSETVTEGFQVSSD